MSKYNFAESAAISLAAFSAMVTGCDGDNRHISQSDIDAAMRPTPAVQQSFDEDRFFKGCPPVVFDNGRVELLIPELTSKPDNGTFCAYDSTKIDPPRVCADAGYPSGKVLPGIDGGYRHVGAASSDRAQVFDVTQTAVCFPVAAGSNEDRTRPVRVPVISETITYRDITGDGVVDARIVVDLLREQQPE